MTHSCETWPWNSSLIKWRTKPAQEYWMIILIPVPARVILRPVTNLPETAWEQRHRIPKRLSPVFIRLIVTRTCLYRANSRSQTRMTMEVLNPWLSLTGDSTLRRQSTLGNPKKQKCPRMTKFVLRRRTGCTTAPIINARVELLLRQEFLSGKRCPRP